MDINNIEICCGSIQSAVNAKDGGAQRIELCQALSEGGTTPSFASIKTAVQDLNLNVFVLIRPRSGNFIYNQVEIKTMQEDIIKCKELGVSGIVVGFLTEDGNIDKLLTKHFVELSKPLPVTFHRAFDECIDPFKALEDIIDCGCARILTSGCKTTALEGAPILKQLVTQAAERITILAGSGITHKNAANVIDITGVTEIHGSCKKLSSNGCEETEIDAVKALLNSFSL